ncbi:MAG: DUF6362 family protein [Acidiphilium sp.]|nr:DUF6362 family protein [Acidiphilium sp.]MDD4934611.1 DUF6362 family protein [Acidiphilium sp.]
MKIMRAQSVGAVLGSGVATRGTLRPCPAVTTAADPLAALTERLEDAGSTLLALPNTGYSPHLRIMRYEVVHSALDAYGWAYGWQPSSIRPPHPSGAAIDRMDEALGWLSIIPEDRFVLRRILGARALTHPLTGRHLYPWRRLGSVLGADHKSVQRWHKDGLGLILTALP